MPSYNFGGGLAGGIAQGLQASGFPESLAKAMDEMRKAREAEAGNNLILEHALQTKQISPEDYTKAKNGSASQKNGIIAGIARNFAQDVQQQQLESLQEQRQAQAELRRQQAEAFNFTPRVVNVPQTDVGGYPYAQPASPDIANPHPPLQSFEVKKGVFIPPQGYQRQSDKVLVTLPDGQQVYMTGNAAARQLAPPKPLSPSQVKSSFATFDVNAHDIANSSAQQGIDAQGNPISPGETPTSIRIQTERGPRIVPLDSFNHLKSLVTGPVADVGSAAKLAPGYGVPSGIPSAAIDFLKKNPNTSAMFDAKYGQGAAANILGQ